MRILLTSIILLIGSQLLAQKVVSKELNDSLQTLNNQDFIKYLKANKDFDLNAGVKLYTKFDPSKTTFFKRYAHAYGFFADDTKKEAVIYMIKNAKTPLKNPLFFLNDASPERAKDIMEYFALLQKNNPKIGEKEFQKIYETYFEYRIDYQDQYGKTIFMYACEYKYLNVLKMIKTKNPSLKIKDNKGKKAKNYLKDMKKK